MTFNVRFGTAPDGPDSWERRRELVLALLLQRAPHVLGLQEALAFQHDWLVEQLAHVRRLGRGRLGGAEGEHASLLVDTRRLHVLEHGDFWLSEEPDRPASVGWDAEVPRVCTWARLADRHDGGELTVWNTHFDHRGFVARSESASLLAARVRSAAAAPAIVLGDLNAGPGSRPVCILRQAGLRDAFGELHPHAGDVGTFHAFRGAARGLRIDYVLVSREWQLRRCEIDRLDRSGRFPSDHFPVWADLVR